MDQMTGCTACGRPIIYGALQCQYCGAMQPRGAPPVQPTAPPGIFCGGCGRPLEAGARFCQACGAAQGAPAAASSTRRDLPSGEAITYHVLVLVAGALLAISPFLPWLTLGALSFNGMQKTGDEAWALVGIGTLAVISGVTSLATKRARMHWGMVVLGLIASVLTAIYFGQMKDNLEEVNRNLADVGAVATLGAGVYLSLVAAGVLSLASIGGAARIRLTRNK